MIKGFTLIELMVVAGIMAFSIIAVSPQIGKYREEQQVRAAAAQLQGALRQAQNNAISGVICAPGKRAEYWGLIMVDDSFTNYKLTPLKYNSVNDKWPEKCADDSTDPNPSPNTATIINNIKLAGVGDDTNPGMCNAPGQVKDLGVAFSNISGKVAFIFKNGSASCSPSGYFDLILSGSAGNVTVRIEKDGSIYVMP